MTETFSFTLDRVSFFVRFRFSPAFPSDDLFSPFSDFTSPGKHVARYRLLFRREKTDLLAYIPSCFHFLPVYKDFTSSKKRILRLKDLAALFVSFQPKTFYFAHSMLRNNEDDTRNTITERLSVPKSARDSRRGRINGRGVFPSKSLAAYLF